MRPVAADDRADRHELVHHSRNPREQLADLDPRHVRLDGLELAADLARRIRLDIPHVLMRRPARQEDVDDRLVRSARARLGFRSQQLRQAEPAEHHAADLEKVATR